MTSQSNSCHESRKNKHLGGLTLSPCHNSHGGLASRRVGQLSPVEEVAILGDRERAPGSSGNSVDREVSHAGEHVHHARPQLVVLAGVSKPPVPVSH